MIDSMMYGGIMRQYDPHMAAAAAAAVAAGLPPGVIKPPAASPLLNAGASPSIGIDPSLIAAASTPVLGGQKSTTANNNNIIGGSSSIPSKSNNNGSSSSMMMMDVDTPTPSKESLKFEQPQHTTASSAEWNLTLNTNVKKHLDVNLLHDLDHNSVVCCVKFSANGKYLATGCKQSAQLYDVESGQKVQTFIEADPNNPHQGDPYIRSVCFSPDNMTLATGAEDRTIKLWDVQSGTIKHNLQGHSLDIYSVDFSRDGRLIVSGSGDRHVKVWDAESGRLLHNLGADDVGPKDGVTSVAFSPDGRFVAAGSLDRVVRIWDVQTGYFIDRFEGHQDSVYSVAFDPEGKTVASGSLDKTLRLWDVSSRSRTRCRHTFVGHKDFVLSVAFSPDGSWIASGSKDRFVHFWDPRTANLLMTLHGHKNSVISVAVCASPTESGKGWFATGSGDHRARIWSYTSLSQQIASSSSSSSTTTSSSTNQQPQPSSSSSSSSPPSSSSPTPTTTTTTNPGQSTV
jgi:general transcriptional corepressor TUP1